jgi:hypothetical protein
VTAPDPRAEVQNVYRYLLSRWAKAKVGGDVQRAIHLFQALDTIRAEWPEVIAADEEE